MSGHTAHPMAARAAAAVLFASLAFVLVSLRSREPDDAPEATRPTVTASPAAVKPDSRFSAATLRLRRASTGDAELGSEAPASVGTDVVGSVEAVAVIDATGIGAMDAVAEESADGRTGNGEEASEPTLGDLIRG